MKEFIDKTAEQSGTKINRRNLLAIQGFIGTNTEFLENGSIGCAPDGGTWRDYVTYTLRWNT